jgi:pantetheine-phosphate adenylyltransferase
LVPADSPRRKYATIAVGGTFDIIHRGHEALLKRAFDTGDRVVIGITSDEFASSSGKKIWHNYEDRTKAIRLFLAEHFRGREYTIAKLSQTFGPGMYTSAVEAIAVSEETAHAVEDANTKRRSLGLPELKIEIVPMVLSVDGEKISSSRIRAGRINQEGQVL